LVAKVQKKSEKSKRFLKKIKIPQDVRYYHMKKETKCCVFEKKIVLLQAKVVFTQHKQSYDVQTNRQNE
jgi:hypothetical protein